MFRRPAGWYCWWGGLKLPTDRHITSLVRFQTNNYKILGLNSNHNFHISCKVKVNVVSVLNSAPRHKDVWGNCGIIPRILNLGTRRSRVVSFNIWPFYSRYPFDWRLGWPQSRSERGGEEKISLPLSEIENRSFNP